MAGSKSSHASSPGSDSATAAASMPRADQGHADHDQVLGLTVHGLPEPGSALAESEQAARRTRVGRWKMLMVLLVCAAPVVASYFTYYVIRPEGRRNFGELIHPQRPLPLAQAVDLEGRSVSLDSLKGQWLLVSVGGGACNEVCQQRLYFQRQLREGMGREKDRMDWVWLINDAQPVSEVLSAGLQQATVLRVAPEVLASWLTPVAGQSLEAPLYVVDPMGNWMMRFPAPMTMDTAPKAKRDLERLLRASSSWDKEGREPTGR
ncbi:SCO family protein [Hylemonella sp. W303a]|uniref:SCO family protein n=1 Tax=Hylemonella sp. W303a TaxID=3389873 RepID=UPI00396B4066